MRTALATLVLGYTLFLCGCSMANSCGQMLTPCGQAPSVGSFFVPTYNLVLAR